MSQVTAIYMGRIIDKKHFRAFIYSTKNDKKLVNSWDEYEAHMASGLWFPEPVDLVPPKDVLEEEPVLEYFKEQEQKKKGREKKEVKPSPAEESVIEIFN